MTPKISHISFFTVLLLILISCTDNKFDVDIKTDIETEVVRFDQILMQSDTSNIDENIELYYQEYPVFFPTYTYGVIKVGGREVQRFPYEILRFINDPTMRDVNAQIQEEFEDVSDIVDEINQALSYYHHYFPEKEIPNLFFMQSGFNQKIIVDSLVLGVALDMCLGADNDYYKQLGLPVYMSARLNRENIALDAMRGLAWSNFTFDGEDNLASNIIYEGKVQYFLDALFPFKTTAEKLSYSDKDFEWVSVHSEEIWNSVIQEEMLYSTDRMQIKNMIENAPFTQAFGNGSPAKVGVWLGYEIVKSYMDSHPELSIKDLMNNQDYISILNESNYRP